MSCGEFSAYAIRLLLEQAYAIVTAGKAEEQFDILNRIQCRLMDEAREHDSDFPFSVERRQGKIASLFMAFCKSGDPVTTTLVHAFSLLINP